MESKFACTPTNPTGVVIQHTGIGSPKARHLSSKGMFSPSGRIFLFFSKKAQNVSFGPQKINRPFSGKVTKADSI